MDEVNFNADDFSDILAKDARFAARAYAFLLAVVHNLSRERNGSIPGEDILEEFKEFALDQYGPLAYTVLTEWGLSRTEDIGEMMFNLVEAHRVERDENDTAEAFANGYDFKETFSGPYQA